MPEAQILGEPLGQLRLQDGAPRVGRGGHGDEQIAMPLIALGNLPSQALGDAKEDVLQPVVEGVENGSQGGSLYQARLLLGRLRQELLVALEKLVELLELELDLRDDFLSQLEPTPVPAPGTGRRGRRRPD